MSDVNSNLSVAYLGVSDFAKRCGVTSQTVLNWIKSKAITPEYSIGKRHFFTESQVADYYISTLKKYSPKSFLGVIVEPSESEVLAKESQFLEVVSNELPNIRKINGIADFISSVCSSDLYLDKEISTMLLSDIITSLSEDYKKVIRSFIMDIYALGKEFESFPYSFFTSLIFGTVDVSSDWYNYYVSLDKGNHAEYSVTGIKLYTDSVFTTLTTCYGVSPTAFSKEQLYYSDIDASAFTIDDISFSNQSVKANKLKSVYTDKLSNMSLQASIKYLCENGYYTSISGVDTISPNVCVDIFERCSKGEFSTLYISNKDLIPQSLEALLPLLKTRGIEVIIGS